MKRLLGVVLVICILAGLFPITVYAETGGQTEVERNDIQVESTNDFGNLLSNELIEQAESDNQNSGGYSVTDLVVENNIATIEYSSLEEAILVVGIYSEDGLKLLASGYAKVSPKETSANVTVDGDVPEYFMASAYLLDIYDYSPLCISYDTPMYTQEMQELLAATVEDYDDARVLNLDNSSITNFAVYSENTKVIEEVAGANIVSSVDDETETYVIQNADEQMTGLQVGDVFAYSYGENEILIAKVANITIDGTTVTISGGELEMEEVFSHVKIEGDSSTAEVEVDDSVADEGVSFEGVVKGGDVDTYALEGEASSEHRFSFYLDFVDDDLINEGSVTLNAKVTGSLDVGIKAEIKYYFSGSRQFSDLKIDLDVAGKLGFNGKLEARVCLGRYNIVSAFGVAIIIIPDILLEVEGKTEIECAFGYSWNYTFDANTGIESRGNPKVADFDFAYEGNAFVGLDLNPAIVFAHERVMKWGLSASAGFKIKSKFTGMDGVFEQDSDVIHACRLCFDLDYFLVTEFKAELELLSHFKYETKPLKFEIQLMEAYYSNDFNEFQRGNCPHMEYRVTIQVTDEQSKAVSGVEVQSDTGEEWGISNKHGVIIKYLPAGTYTISATINGKAKVKTFDVTQASLVSLSEKTGAGGSRIPGPLGDIDSETITDRGIVASGECGAEGGNIIWTLYSDGLLEITGSGKMADWGAPRDGPWENYDSFINTVTISEGIVNIGDDAFYECGLSSIQIPESVVYIGSHAFDHCYALTNIDLPDTLKEMEYGVFAWSDLTHIRIPKSMTVIPSDTFSACLHLKSVEFHEGITAIEAGAFWGSGLTEIAFPNSLKRIGESAFGETILEIISLPEGVEILEQGAFHRCYGVKHIDIAASVKEIGDGAFQYCGNPLGLGFGDPITVTFRGNAPSFIETPFYGVKATVYYPAGDATWNADTMQDYGGTLTWIPYTVDSSGTLICDESAALVTASTQEKDTAPISLQSEDDTADAIDAAVSTFGVWGGEYETIPGEAYTLKTASFTGLVPGEQYVMLALVDINTQNLLAAENLLSVQQASAANDGTLKFQYVQRKETSVSYVIACGASNQNLKDAEITFPEMIADGELQAVTPVVRYGGKTLSEGTDYVIVGTVSYTDAGEYTCYIRGIHNYAGLVKCAYTVRCSNHIFDQEVMQDEYVANEATCTSAATYYKSCKCGERSETETFEYGEPKGHQYGKYGTIVISPSCTEKGYTVYTCFCDDIYVDDYVDALGHSWQYHNNRNGTHSRTCATCGTTDLENAPHNYLNGSCLCGATETLGRFFGDLDLDGDVDSDDLTLLARHVGGIEMVDGQALMNADVNGDGVVNSDDLTKHARYVGGIITEWDQD